MARSEAPPANLILGLPGARGPAADHYSLSVFDTLGRRVQTLFDGQLPLDRVLFEARDLPTGM